MTYDKDSFLAGLSVGMSLRHSKRISAPPNCLTFSSLSPFTFSIVNSSKNWDGTIEWSTNLGTWNTWDGSTTLTASQSGNEYVIYLRGTGNTRITGTTSNHASFQIAGTNIRCSGDIRSLLDYADVENTNMANYCFCYLFGGCTELITPPRLPATTLSRYCYQAMFIDCEKLTTMPELPALSLEASCYYKMFAGCKRLTNFSPLPATTLAPNCYSRMFRNCWGLIQAPQLQSTSVAVSCYELMFADCKNLVAAPHLPATTLANNCYAGMFSGCESLIEPPHLPATTLALGCYKSMFLNCKNLQSLPSLAALNLPAVCYDSMFSGCEKIKISSSQSPSYPNEYRIPSSGTGTMDIYLVYPTHAMFANTGGAFTGQPTINTTYYTSNQIV